MIRREPISKKQERDEIVFFENEQNPFTGIFFETWPDGKLALEINYKEGKKHRLTTAWFENGLRKAELNFKGGERQGLFRYWHGNGELKSEINYQDDKEHGVQKSWNETGQMCRIPPPNPIFFQFNFTRPITSRN